MPEIPAYAIQLHFFLLLYNLTWLHQAEHWICPLTELFPFPPSPDTDHPSESRHRSGHVEQLAQTHRLSALIPRKSRQ